MAVLLMGVAQFALLSTEVGKQLALDQNISAMEAFGVTISDETYAQMERSMDNARYTGPIFTMIAIPVFMRSAPASCT